MTIHRLYHLTEKENVNRILKNGLVPKIGRNSQMAKELEPCIYLARSQDVPYWAIILNKYEVLSVDIDDNLFSDLEEFEYSNYKEYLYHLPIPASCIHKSSLSTTLEYDKYKTLLLSYLEDMSEVCVSFAKYIAYYNLDKEYAMQNLEYVELCINIYKSIIPRFNYDCISTRELHEALVKSSESGNYTICDNYDYRNLDNAKRPKLWQLLGRHELSTDTTKWLYKWLRVTFPNKLYIDTGGWTG